MYTGGTAGETPIQLYLAHSDYSSAEIEEYVELSGLLGPNNLVEKETSKRLIRELGGFHNLEVTGETVIIGDGKPLKTRLNWLVADGFTINLFSYNNTGGQLTTGGVVRVIGHINGFWA